MPTPVRATHAAELRHLGPAAVREYLTIRSGLPGPRANLELMQAFADVAAPALIHELSRDDDVYLRCCGTVGLGRLYLEGADDERAAVRDRLTHLAGDPSWRVREATAMAAQRIGDGDPAAVRAIAGAWASDPDPLVARAGIAALCEPRLLRDPLTATAALAACAAATDTLRSVPTQDRRAEPVRVLRQALGYCWSVAVVGDPAAGLPAFAELRRRAADDTDLTWVVTSNAGKHRLRRLLGTD